eukprot:1158504-Pelagomonas_calceolata.AAC.2
MLQAYTLACAICAISALHGSGVGLQRVSPRLGKCNMCSVRTAMLASPHLGMCMVRKGASPDLL